MNRLDQVAKDAGAAGIAHVRLKEGQEIDSLEAEDFLLSPGLRMQVDWSRRLAHQMNARPGDLILLMAGAEASVNQWLSAMRSYMGDRLGLIDEDALAFAFVTDFPLFDWDSESRRWDSTHHPFTSPAEGEEALLDGGDLGNINSRAYDLVCNGSELASGSIRIHHRKLQERVFQILAYSQEEMNERFGQLLEALEYGAPPMAALPRESTAWWRYWPGRGRSATSSRSPKPRAAATCFSGRRLRLGTTS